VSFPGAYEPKSGSLPEWYEPSEENNFQRYVRVIVTTKEDASILVIFANPSSPEYTIQNETDKEVFIRQEQVGRDKIVPARTKLGFAWDNRLLTNRKLEVKIDDFKEHLNIDKVLKKKTIEGRRKDALYHVEVLVTGSNKKVVISTIEKKQEAMEPGQLEKLMWRFSSMQMRLHLDLVGVGVSFIDNEPKELIYASLYNIQVEIDTVSTLNIIAL